MRLTPGSVDAVVLAGGWNRIILYPGYQPGYKALIEYGGRPSLAYTLDAVRGSRYVRGVCLVGPEDSLREAVGSEGYRFAPGGESPLASVANGLAHFRDSESVLITGADLPLITPRAVDEFLEGCAEAPTSYQHNAFLAAVPGPAFTGDFAGCAKPFMRFRDIAVCHGNLVLIEPRMFDVGSARSKLNALYAARKNPIGCALAIGFRVGVSYLVGVHLLHRLTLAEMAAIASWRFGVGIVPVIVNRPEIAVDVDEAADYRLVTALLEARAG